MITCTLGEKKYTMDFVSGRALREMEPAAKTYGKLVRLSQDAVEGKDIAEEQIGSCITKEKSVDYCINGGFIPANEKERALIPGMMKSDYSLDKTFVFLFMTRPDRQEGAVYYLIDDTTETNLTGNENAFTINPTDL